MLSIRLANTQEELQAIYRLRYQVYVEELGADMKYAHHHLKELCEPWDATGNNIGAWLDGQLVGCVRFNSAATTDFSEYDHLFRVPMLRHFIACSPADFSFSSKLAVPRNYRSVSLAKLLIQAVYDLMRVKGAALNFVICQTKRINAYRRFGWQVCGAPFFHPEGGLEVPMVIVTQDWAYLRSIQSPFLALCEQYPNDQKRATRFSQFYSGLAPRLVAHA